MGDHFVLLVDRLLTESTLEAAIESRKRCQQDTLGGVEATLTDISTHKMDSSNGSAPRKLVECRICQDEDEDTNMETPCSCRGSLKYAHRRCVQRWCNEKGDTICEICHKPFRPGYTAPPPLFQYGGIPMNFRGNWEISRRDLHNPQFIPMFSTDSSFPNPGYDEYLAPTSRSLMCCRTVAIIFMVLLVLRHALPILTSEPEDHAFASFMLLQLKICGILLPIYLTVKAVTVVRRHRRLRQEARGVSHDTSGEEDEQQTGLQPQQHSVHVH